MQATTVVDANAPGGQLTMDLPTDFVELIECKPHEPLEPFLANNSPLTAHACWVYVHAPTQGVEERGGINESLFQSGLSFLKSRGDCVTLSEVNDVAHRSRCTSGKWKIRVEAAHLEGTWGRIAKAVHTGALGKVCMSAKVSTTTTQTIRGRGSEHTVYVYVDNYLREESVSQLRSALQKILRSGFSSGGNEEKGCSSPDEATLAQFKPDIYTYMGWGTGRMPPSIPVYLAMEPLCSSCGKRGGANSKTKLKKCTACRSAQYCNVDCQRAHRKTHRAMCNAIAKERDLRAAGHSNNKDAENEKPSRGEGAV